ncbi:MAG: hypothetical protein KDC07_04425 [Chitinophagaceae bacterium]|nr:hypothetical protein [Chitinophagaceae bacterium]MCB9045287.1 hypothetical protein [Chitinophagales bacterium]
MSETTNGAEVSVATANGYITDFITDYYDTGKVPVKSMIMSASLLRTYLANAAIENVKFMLGSRKVDINGTETEVLTLVVGGYDANGNYVLTTNGEVLDHMAPCPNSCPTVGDAASDTIIVS